MISANGGILDIPAVDLNNPSRLRWWMQPAFSGSNIDLEKRSKDAWQMYRAVMSTPSVTKFGDIYVVTKPEKIRWWIRCQLVKWRVI